MTSEEGKSEYKKYRNSVNRAAKKAKEKWLNNVCKDINSCLTKGLNDKAYKNIKRFFREYKGKATILRGIDGNIITEGKKNMKKRANSQRFREVLNDTIIEKKEVRKM